MFEKNEMHIPNLNHCYQPNLDDITDRVVENCHPSFTENQETSNFDEIKGNIFFS